MKREIIELREVIGKLVPLLTGKGLIVTQRGSQAYVEVDPKTRKPRRVNIPNISDNATPEFIRAIQGFIDHEVAHVLITNWDDYIVQGDRSSKKVQRLQMMVNIVEDTMIERELPKRFFPGSRKNIADMRRHFVDKITIPACKQAKDDKELFQVILVPVMRALAGHEEFQEFMDRFNYWENPYVKELLDKLSPATIEILPKITETRQTRQIAEELDAILYPPRPSQPQSNSEDEENDGESQCSFSECNGNSKGDNQGHDEEQEDDSEGAASSGGSNDDDDAKQDESSRGGSGGEKEEGDKDEENESAGSGGDSEEEEDKNSDESSGSGDSGEDEESDGAGNDDGGEDEGEGSGAGDGEDEEGDESGTSGEEDEEDGDSESSGTGDGEEEDENEEGGSGGSDGAENSDGDDGDEGSSNERQKRGDTIAFDDRNHSSGNVGSEDTRDSGGGVGGDNGGGRSMFDFEDEAFENADISSQISIFITNEAVETISRSDYTVFTREFDRIEPLNPPEKINSRWIPELEDMTRQMVGRMQKDIERMLASQSYVVRTPGWRSGRLHSPALHRLKTGDDRIFNRRQEHKSKDTAVTLLIDNSGSMQGRKIYTAMVAGYALSSTLERVSIANEVIGFTTTNWWGIPKSMEDAMLEEFDKFGVTYSRKLPIVMPIYKSFDERVTPMVKKRIAYVQRAQEGLQGNIDGESLEYAAIRLAKRREKRKVMIVLSDGHPVNATNAAGHLKLVVQDLNKAGIETIGIGIMDDAVRSFYPKYVVLNDINDLPGQIMRELREILAN